MAKRKRYFRVVRVKLECGCTADLNTGRYRVGKDTTHVIVGNAARRGVWCFTHSGMCQPTEVVGIFRE